MVAVTESTIRASFVNASKKEISDLSLPENFDSIDFDRLDYLGWRDRKIARRAAWALFCGGSVTLGSPTKARHPR